MSKETYRSKIYLDFVKELKCTVSASFALVHASKRCQGQIIPHHTETGGVGMKGDDLSCIPLCNVHHSELHNNGVKTFSDKYSIDIQMTVTKTLQKYVMMHDGNPPDDIFRTS